MYCLIMLQPWPWAHDQSKDLQRSESQAPKSVGQCEGMNFHTPK
jgi:hypothetical protein